ncbi:uncharacterized protein Mfe2 isoform X1 [Lepeophtheirus salmonis]|uniref:uncharacterized protein Mfe2 isoform X1 n=1 Tax=Lepeophtheirus salmonis TaxID=72036 RepID=UPI001AE562C0|nr:peroxisomal multifunctional enzyme type 2-like isoform X1 [Lepeophtheirus salmonis]
MRYSKYITKKLDMEKKYSLKDKSVLLLNSLNHDFITKIYEEIKNCGAKCIDILENIDEFKPKYDSGIVYFAQNSFHEDKFLSLTRIFKNAGKITFLVKIQKPLLSTEYSFVLSLYDKMKNQKFSFNIFLAENLEDVQSFDLLPFIIWSISDASEIKGTILSLESNLVTMGKQNNAGASEQQTGSDMMTSLNNKFTKMTTTEKDINMGEEATNDSKVFIPLIGKGYTSKKFSFTYGPLNSILYSMGIGVSLVQENGLMFLYEDHPKFSIHPGFAVIPTMECLNEVIYGHVPNLHIEINNVLHGEQYTEILSSIPHSGTLESQFKIIDILDKGKTGAIILIHVDTFCKYSGKHLIKNQFSLLVLGKGGFGGSRKSPFSIEILLTKPENIEPDHVVDFKTSFDQAALYRLNGDRNPLHIDPSQSALIGFNTPILHGLCTQGIVLTGVMNTFGNGKSESISSIKARFSKPVIPGQTIRTKLWRSLNDTHIIIFSCIVQETGEECSLGWVCLN